MVDFIIVTQENKHNSMMSELIGLRKDFYGLFPKMDKIDLYPHGNKRRSTPIHIILTDEDKSRLETEIENQY